jgi:hypothetical protein
MEEFIFRISMIYKKKENNLSLIFLISIIIGICFACDSHKKETKNKVSEYMGDTLYLPTKSEVLYKDSLYKKTNPINNKAKLKISTLLWGNCHSCIADLKKWEKFYQFVEKKKEVEILFYLYTSDIKFFRKSLYKKEIHKYPLILDKKLKYIDRNKLPFKNKTYQTFLLDSNNKVILVGNPIHGDKLMKLYKKEINKRLN